MQLSNLRSNIIEKKYAPFYLFAGQEVAIMDIYIKQVAESLGLKIVNLDTVSAAYKQMQLNELGGGTKKLFVVRNDKSYQSMEKSWDRFMSGEYERGHVLIVANSSYDKRLKMYKRHSDALVIFDFLPVETLVKYVDKALDKSFNYREELVDMCGCNYSRILLECDKIYHLAKSRNISFSEAFNVGRVEHLFYVPPKDAIFSLTDAVCDYKISSVWEHLYQCKLIGESPLAVISVLFNNFQAMLAIQSDGGGSGVCDRTGVTPWMAKISSARVGKYTNEQLVENLRILQFAEQGVKTGAVDSDVAMEYVILKILYA